MPSNMEHATTLKALGASLATLSALLGTIYYLDWPLLPSRRSDSGEVEARCYSSHRKPSIEDFKTLTSHITQRSTYPLASEIKKNVPIYDCAKFHLTDTKRLDRLQDEFYHILTRGPGVFVMKRFFANLDTIDTANRAFDAIVERERRENVVVGDHFAPASANSRIWNSFSKHAIQDSDSFAEYFSNPWFKVVCESYLGPAYRLTSQVNIVRPGGRPQMPHRDYHLGFQTDQDVLKWPKSVHAMSAFLTLQGAVAHTDMPLESGPTRLLPFSQMFEEGFRSYRSKEFVEHFEKSYIALPLQKGDAIFFNPALFHAAGANDTEDFSRSANLIQVSSAFGKPMETIDTLALIEHTYDALSAKYKAEGFSNEVDACIAAVAEGYSFPTNLDCRPPAPGGQAPESQQAMLKRGLGENWDKQKTMLELQDMREASSAAGKVAR